MPPPAPPQPPSAPPRTADAAMLLVCLIWGWNFSVTKLALAEIPPLAFTALRFAAASLLLWAVLRVRGVDTGFPAGGFWRLVVLGVVGNTLYQLGFVLGLARTTASNSALILATVPAAVAVLGALLGVERLTRRVALGTLVATLGVVLVVATRGVAFTLETLQGDLLTAGAVLCWAGYTLGLRPLAGRISPLRVTALTMFTGAPGLLLVGLPELLALDWRAVGAIGWGGLAYASVFSLVVAYLLWNSSVRTAGASRTAIYLCVTPVVAVAVAWILLGERPAPLQGIGAGLIVAGVLLTRRATPQAEELAEPAEG